MSDKKTVVLIAFYNTKALGVRYLETALHKAGYAVKTIFFKGFNSQNPKVATEKEIELLPVGAMMMTLECGMRFLADYLSGDTYFKTSRPAHNLDRARNQFKLLYDMEKSLPKMRKIVEKHAK